jgi:hypothetical protein
MEVISSSETSVYTRSTRRHNLEDSILHDYGCLITAHFIRYYFLYDSFIATGVPVQKNLHRHFRCNFSWIWGSHGGDEEEFCLFGCHAVYSCKAWSEFPRRISPPSSGSKSEQWINPERNRRQAIPLTVYLLLVSYLAYVSVLNMKTIYSFEMSVASYKTTWLTISEDKILRDN